MQEDSDSLFSKITNVAPDPIFGINDRFFNDPRPTKYNLTIGIFVDEEGNSAQILPSVHLAEKEILRLGNTKNYLPIDGDAEYVELTKKLIFGPQCSDRIYGAQTIGGTSALRTLSDFIKNEISDTISIPNPTWDNHENIFKRVGFNIDKYPYPNGMFEHLSNLKPNTIVLLHGSCHNPTGIDLSKDEIEKLERLFRERKLIAFFDSAYQGFGKGLDDDAYAIRYFVEKGHEILVAHSYSKSFSLYGERVGALFIVLKDKSGVDLVKRNIRSLIRTTYSNPQRHGAYVVKLVLQNANFRSMWELEVCKMRSRMDEMRKIFSKKLKDKISNKMFPTLEKGHGFFTLLGLSSEESDRLRDEFGIYMASRSRINLTTLNAKNIDYIVDSISKVV